MRSAFLRLALVAGGCALVVAVAVVWQVLGWPAAVAAATVGPLVALLVTVETTQGTAKDLNGHVAEAVRSTRQQRRDLATGGTE